ncbi:MAG: hypothetical protein R3F34_11085 [Planctomycetota bacterium]
MEDRDTCPEARRRIVEQLRAWTPEERFERTIGLYQLGVELQIAGERARRPDASEEELRFRAGVRRIGRDLARRAYGADHPWIDG